METVPFRASFRLSTAAEMRVVELMLRGDCTYGGTPRDDARKPPRLRTCIT
jgi:hypothetical protein